MSEVAAAHYLELVRHLSLLKDSAEIRKALDLLPWVDQATLVQTFEQRLQCERDAGHPASTRLLERTLSVVRSWVAENLSASPWPDFFDERLTHAAEQATALRVLRMIRKGPSVGTEQFRMIHSWIASLLEPGSAKRFDTRLPAPERLAQLPFLIGVASGSRSLKFQGLLFWLAWLLAHGRAATALRKLSRVKLLAPELDSENRILLAGLEANLYFGTGDFGRVIETLRQALDWILPNDRVGGLAMLKKLEAAHENRGELAEAVRWLDQAVILAKELQMPEQEMFCRNRRARALQKLGSLDLSASDYAKAEAIAEAIGDRDIQFVTRNSVMSILIERNQPEKALEHAQRTLRLVEAWADPRKVAAAHNNLGQVLLSLQRSQAARVHFLAALELKQSASEKRGEAIAWFGLADTAEATGDREGALTLLTCALIPTIETGDPGLLIMYTARQMKLESDPAKVPMREIEWCLERARRARDRQLESLCLDLLCDAYERTGRAASAIAICRERLTQCSSSDEIDVVVPMRQRLATLLMQEEAGRQEADRHLRDAIERVERQSSQTVVDEHRAEWDARWVNLYAARIDLLTRSRNADANADAFQLHESVKARSFVAQLADCELPRPAGIPDELWMREQHLLRVERELQDPIGTGYTGSENARIERLRQTADELQECWDAISDWAPEYVRMRSGRPANPELLRQMIAHRGGKTALVSFFCAETETTVFVLRADRDEIGVYRCAIGRNALFDAARRLLRTFNGAATEFPPYPPIRRDRPYERDLEFLDGLSGPLLGFLSLAQGAEHLCIAPHGPLHLLPLHALRTPAGTYAIEKFAITYAPSLTSLLYSELRHAQEDDSVGLPRNLYYAGVAAREDSHPELFENDAELFENSAWKVVADCGPAASRERVLAGMQAADYVHIACHGYVDSRRALQSALVVGDGERRPNRDPEKVSVFERSRYLVTARDLLRIGLRCRLITLRACSTAVQRERNKGDEFEGLLRALVYAGGSGLITSLWNVDQASSRTIMRILYQHLSGGEPVWKALQRAQVEMLDSEEPHLRHPYHWAPFVLTGDFR